ncbi:conserved hypothetical protein [uncultured Paludibacter sp.]|uniref:Lipoprotein n=1 Tax=uncultured Paludibacter sp. TaxID=497635 RepID=A0A653AH01_9BACT|nr:conserved hypothetical protein [uncultured Paludibacter sp.]
MNKIIYFFIFLMVSCQSVNHIQNGILPLKNKNAITGNEFVKKTLLLSSNERENLIAKEIIAGNFPNFMRKWEKINVTLTLSDKKIINAYYYVLPDYLMIGSDKDFCRMPMQPKTAQKIADKFNCFLSTRKICNDIYKAAKVKLEPYPLTINRDSLLTFYQHNQIIENQRKGRKGLIAGIKKDVVISSAISQSSKPNRVAIYGWHKLDGTPIQPLYTGHVDWYVDYSHGIRLVWRTIYIDGKPMDYTDVLNNPELSSIICDESECNFYAYPYNKNEKK